MEDLKEPCLPCLPASNLLCRLIMFFINCLTVLSLNQWDTRRPERMACAHGSSFLSDFALKHSQVYKTKVNGNKTDLTGTWYPFSKCYLNNTQIYKYLFYKHINILNINTLTQEWIKYLNVQQQQQQQCTAFAGFSFLHHCPRRHSMHLFVCVDHFVWHTLMNIYLHI